MELVGTFQREALAVVCECEAPSIPKYGQAIAQEPVERLEHPREREQARKRRHFCGRQVQLVLEKVGGRKPGEAQSTLDEVHHHNRDDVPGQRDPLPGTDGDVHDKQGAKKNAVLSSDYLYVFAWSGGIWGPELYM